MIFRRDPRVTIPAEGDIYFSEIPVERILAYEVGAVPAPVQLPMGQPLPVRRVESVKVKDASGAWHEL